MERTPPPPHPHHSPQPPTGGSRQHFYRTIEGQVDVLTGRMKQVGERIADLQHRADAALAALRK